jgi:hypothetical protein
MYGMMTPEYIAATLNPRRYAGYGESGVTQTRPGSTWEKIGIGPSFLSPTIGRAAPLVHFGPSFAVPLPVIQAVHAKWRRKQRLTQRERAILAAWFRLHNQQARANAVAAGPTAASGTATGTSSSDMMAQPSLDTGVPADVGSTVLPDVMPGPVEQADMESEDRSAMVKKGVILAAIAGGVYWFFLR